MMKADIVRKMNEHIEMLLQKPELTNEEYMILRDKLFEIKHAEDEAARQIDWESKMKPVLESVFKQGFFGGGCSV